MLLCTAELWINALVAGLMTSGAPIFPEGDSVYNLTFTAKGPVATEKQVVKPSALVAFETPDEEVHFAKLASKKYQAAFVYSNDGSGRPQQTYAVAWDPQKKESLGLLRLELMNTTDAAGFISGCIKPVAAYTMPEALMPSYMSLLAGSALPYTYLDGWGSFGQKGENFNTCFAMAWMDADTKDFVRGLLGGKSLAMVLSEPKGIDKIIENLDEKTIVKLLDILKNGAGVGLAGGCGYGTMAFDKKTQTVNVSKVSGQGMVLDFNTAYVPYEVWNIYTGRSLTNLGNDVLDIGQAFVDDGLVPPEFKVQKDGKETTFEVSEIIDVLKFVLPYLQPSGFVGYGAFDIKYNKSGSKTLSAEQDPAARVAAFLKAAKAPKYVTAADVIDLRANYLSYMFNGRTEDCVEILGKTIRPMTISNVLYVCDAFFENALPSNNVLEVGGKVKLLNKWITDSDNPYGFQLTYDAADFPKTKVEGLEKMKDAYEQATFYALVRRAAFEEGSDKYKEVSECVRRYKRNALILSALIATRDNIVLRLEADAIEAAKRGLGVWETEEEAERAKKVEEVKKAIETTSANVTKIDTEVGQLKASVDELEKTFKKEQETSAFEQQIKDAQDLIGDIEKYGADYENAGKDVEAAQAILNEIGGDKGLQPKLNDVADSVKRGQETVKGFLAKCKEMEANLTAALTNHENAVNELKMWLSTILPTVSEKNDTLATYMAELTTRSLEFEEIKKVDDPSERLERLEGLREPLTMLSSNIAEFKANLDAVGYFDKAVDELKNGIGRIPCEEELGDTFKQLQADNDDLKIGLVDLEADMNTLRGNLEEAIADCPQP